MRILCLGDVAISNDVTNPWPHPLGSRGKDELRVLYNWELPIGNVLNPSPRTRGPRLLSDPNSIHIVHDWSPGFAALATNHVLDAGDDGLIQTKARLQQAGFQTLGAGQSAEEISQPLYWITDQGNLAIVNWVFPETHPDWEVIPGPNCWPGLELAKQMIEELKEKSDWILVAPHWGDECFPYPAPVDRNIAKELIRAGADLIIGHHPHVVRGMELFDRKPVFYSLGNFYFSDFRVKYGAYIVHAAPRSREALGVDITFERGQKPRYQAVSYWQADAQTKPDPSGRAVRRMRQTSRPLIKLAWDEYPVWYQKRRKFFNRWEYKMHFSVWQKGLSGLLRYPFVKFRKLRKDS